MVNSSNSSSEEGNNSNLLLCENKQIAPAVGWCFTFNNWSDEIVLKFQEIIKVKCKLGFFNKEIGKKKKIPHLQGYLEFLKKSRPFEVFPLGAHWAKAKGNKDENFKYCSKDVEGIELMTFNFGFKLNPPIEIIEVLRPFQQDLLDICLGPVNKGKVIWVYDKKGQLGKTEFLRYMAVKYKIPFTYGGSSHDIINMVFNQKEYLLSTNKAVLIYNFGKDTKPNRIAYKSMEQVADACISNNKFETGFFVCNKPHVIVLANCLPKYNGLNEERWIMYSINPETYKLEKYTREENEIGWDLDDDTDSKNL